MSDEFTPLFQTSRIPAKSEKHLYRTDWIRAQPLAQLQKQCKDLSTFPDSSIQHCKIPPLDFIFQVNNFSNQLGSNTR